VSACPPSAPLRPYRGRRHRFPPHTTLNRDARRHPRPRCRLPCAPVFSHPRAAWRRADSHPCFLATSPAAARRCSGRLFPPRRCPMGPASMQFSPWLPRAGGGPHCHPNDVVPLPRIMLHAAGRLTTFVRQGLAGAAPAAAAPPSSSMAAYGSGTPTAATPVLCAAAPPPPPPPPPHPPPLVGGQHRRQVGTRGCPSHR